MALRNATCARPLRVAGTYALTCMVAAAVLAACAETSLNEAPIVDRSAQPGANATAPHGAPANAGAPAGPTSAPEWYTVQKGDTLFHISTTFHCSVQDLSRWNGLAEGTQLTAGQRLRVRAPAAPPVTAAVPALSATGTSAEATEPAAAEVHALAVPATGGVETRTLEAAPVGANPPAPAPASTAAPAPPSVVSNAPVGAAAVSALPFSPAQASNAEKPGGSAPAVAASSAPAADRPTASVPWIWPVDGRVTGKFDAASTKGIEIATAEGAKILAVADGEVIYTGAPRDYGNLVIVRHPDGLLSAYAHTKSILVTQAQTVKRGQAIATAGKTEAGAPSLHFEVRRKGVPIDPLEILPPR